MTSRTAVWLALGAIALMSLRRPAVAGGRSKRKRRALPSSTSDNVVEIPFNTRREPTHG